MTEEKKKTFHDEFVKDFKRLTGITDLTGQDVYGALVLMTRKGQIPKYGRSLWSKSQWDYLYHRLLDTANPYNDITEVFKAAINQTRIDRHRKYPITQKRKEEPEENTEPIYRASEEDMQTVSNQLLWDDEVYY